MHTMLNTYLDYKMEGIEDGPRILGLGIGLFLLILMWSITFLLVIVCARLSSGTGMALTCVSTIVTAILVAMPRHPPKLKGDSEIDTDDDQFQRSKIYDTDMVWRLVILVVLSVILVVSLVAVLCVHAMRQVQHQPLKKQKT